MEEEGTQKVMWYIYNCLNLSNTMVPLEGAANIISHWCGIMPALTPRSPWHWQWQWHGDVNASNDAWHQYQQWCMTSIPTMMLWHHVCINTVMPAVTLMLTVMLMPVKTPGCWYCVYTRCQCLQRCLGTDTNNDANAVMPTLTTMSWCWSQQ